VLSRADDAQDGLDVSASASTRVVAGKQYVSGKVTNNEDVSEDVVVETAYGSKSFSSVQPADYANASSNSRYAAIPAGEATATATADVDGVQLSVTKTAAYDAAG